MAQGVTQIVPTFWLRHLFSSNLNNGPSPGHSNLGSDGRYTCPSLPFMVSWVPYLNKGPRPDFNNGPGLTQTVAALSESDFNNGQSSSDSNLVSEGAYIFSGLLLTVSWWMPYLSKGHRPDFNNGLGSDSNSGPTLASVVF